MKTQTTQLANWISMDRCTHPKTGRVHYMIRVHFYASPRQLWRNRDDIAKHFCPTDIRGFSSSWKYRNRATAEQLALMAILKWGE